MNNMLFLAVMRAGLKGEPLKPDIKDVITPQNISETLEIAINNDLGHIMGYVLKREGIETEGETAVNIEKAEMLALYRATMFESEIRVIKNTFEEAKIKYIPLKGAILREYYDNPVMRTSCDIDILVREEDLETAIKSLEDKEYKVEKRAYHDVSMMSKTGVHLELHFNILEDHVGLDKVLATVWDHAVLKSGYEYELDSEFFMYHQMAHISYHFTHGGCGFRSLADIWILKSKLGFTPETAKTLLEIGEIYEFACNMYKIMGICFEKEKPDKFLYSVLAYIINGGVYGTREAYLAIELSRKNGKFLYFLKRIFMPYKKMITLYPRLRKYPVLLPYYWVKRWIRTLFSDSFERLAGETKTAAGMDAKTSNDLVQMCENMGLKL